MRKPASWYFFTGSDPPEIYHVEIPLEGDSITKSKIFQRPVIFTYGSLTTKFVGAEKSQRSSTGRAAGIGMTTYSYVVNAFLVVSERTSSPLR